MAGFEERALSWGLQGSSPPLPPVTEQGGWINCLVRPKVYHTGRGCLEEDPSPLVDSPAAPGLSWRAESLRLSASVTFL